jgi:hypothetical protein
LIFAHHTAKIEKKLVSKELFVPLQSKKVTCAGSPQSDPAIIVTFKKFIGM